MVFRADPHRSLPRATVPVRVLVLPQEGDVDLRSVRLLSFELGEQPTPPYATGDHIAVHPLNDPQRVLRTARLLGLTGRLDCRFDAYIAHGEQRLDAALPVRLPLTLKEALRLHLDLALHYHDFTALFRVFVEVAEESNKHPVVEEVRDWQRVSPLPPCPRFGLVNAWHVVSCAWMCPSAYLKLRGSISAPGIFFLPFPTRAWFCPPSPNNLEYLLAVPKNLVHPLHAVYDDGKGGGWSDIWCC